MKYLDQIMSAISPDKTILFNEVVGYDELKETFEIFLSSKKSINVLLTGPPASCKTLFLLAMMKHYGNRAAFVDAGGNASGPGMIEKMSTHKPKPKILLIDEIDGLSRGDQKSLFNLLETGILISTKVTKSPELKRGIKFENLKVFATCNEIDYLTSALQSRFFRIHLREYTEKEFNEISCKLYPKKPTDLMQYIAGAVWHVIGSRDVRDVIKIADHAENTRTVDLLIDVQQKYAPPEVTDELEEIE